MKETIIQKAGARIWRAKLTRPFRTAKGQHDLLENVLFTVELSNGIQGFGEAAVATHITGETVPGTLGNLKKVSGRIAGCELSTFPEIAEMCRKPLAGNPCALAALEMAFLDAAAREMGIPLWRAFGSVCRTLRTDMTVVLGDVADAETAARGILRRGIRSLKVKIGRDFDLDLKRVIAVAKIARKFPLYLDANQGFTAEQTLKFLKELVRAKIKPALVEQPVPKGDWDGLKKVTREGGILVCADESVSSLEDAKRLIRSKAAGAINIKLMKTGVLEAYEIAKLAQKHGIKLMIGTMMESPLATTAAAHLAAGLGGFDFIDLDAPLFIDSRITQGFNPRTDGVYDLRKIKTGIGVVPLGL